MADPAEAPDIDPFEQIAKGSDTDAAPTDPTDPFEQIAKSGGTPQSSATGAFTRSAARGVLPAVGSLPAIGAGAEMGAGLGLLTGPFAEVASPVGGVVGGLAGGFFGAEAVAKFQDWALKQLPDSWTDALGMSERQEKLDQGEHPVASFLGGLAPYAVTMRPGAVPTTALPENATALQRVLAHPLTSRLFGGAAMGGMELGQEAAEDDHISWPRVAVSTAFGLVFNRPTRIGEAITELGAKPTRTALGIPHPTVAQAADAKVMGPGVTEDVFQGSQQQDPVAEQTAQDTARTEQAVLNPQAQTEDLHQVARRMWPELFSHYDDLVSRESALREWVGEVGADEAPAASGHLATIREEIAKVTPEVQAAYRRAAEATGAETVAPEGQRFRTMADMLAAQGEPAAVAPAEAQAPPEAPAPVPEGAAPPEAAPTRTIEQQRDFIRNDVAEKLIAAGRPHEEAQAAGAIIAARYGARASRFNGALGTAEDLYRREGAEIKGRKPPAAGGGAAPTEPAPPLTPSDTAAVPETAPETAPAEPVARTPVAAARGGGMVPEYLKPGILEKAEVGKANAKKRLEKYGGGTIRVYTSAAAAAKARGLTLKEAKAAHDAAQAEHGAAFDAMLRDEGMSPSDVPDEIRYAALEAMEKLGRNARDAMDYADAHVEEAAQHDSALDAMLSREGIYFQRRRAARDLIAEREAEGQLQIPGAERITPTEQAQRKADEPLRPSVEQKPMDEGLFSDQAGQKELFQHRPYSRVPDSLMGFPREGFTKPYEEQGYRHEQPVKVTFEDGQTFYDAVKGLNEPHALERARRNWPGAEVEPATWDEAKEFFQGPLGRVRIVPGRKPIITLAKTADASTFIHESGHVFLEELMRDAEHEAAPDSVRQDAQTVRTWLGVENADAIKTKHHEKFAKGFEQYLREGVAPSPALARVFAQFRDWLLRIYQSLKGLGSPINGDIRGVFDRLLESEPQRTVIAPERMERPSLADIHEADAQETERPEKHAAGDRVIAEIRKFEDNVPGVVRDELARTEEATEAESAAEPGSGPAAAEPAGEAGLRPEPAAEIPGAGGQPQPVAASGAGGAEPRPELRGGNEPLPGGNGVRSGGERPGAAGGADAGLGDKPLAPRPGALLTEPDSLNLGKAGNIRVENITSVDQFVQAIEESSERIAAEKGGADRLTMGEMVDLADDLAIDPKDINEKQLAAVFGGVKNLSSKIWALRTAVRDNAQIVHELAVRARDSQKPEDIAAAAQALSRQDMLQSVLSSVTTETGRGLGMSFRNMEGWEKAQDLNQFLKDSTGKTLFQWQRITQLASTLDTPQKVAKFARDADKRTFGKMVMEYWINGLISGPATHVTYMIGNQILAMQKAGPETAAAALVGALQKMRGRQGETVRAGEVGAQLRAVPRSFSPALKAALDAFRTGVTTRLPGEEGGNLLPFQPGTELAAPATLDEAAKLSDAMDAAFGIMRGIRDGFRAGGALSEAAPRMAARYSPLGAIPDIEIGGVNALPLGTLARLPSRFIAAIHSFYRSVNYSMDKAALAYRAAANEGLTGDAFDARVADLHQNPTQDMMDKATGTATQLTLMGQGGEFTRALSRLTNAPVFGFPLLKFIDPFVHISSNIIEQAIIERTPLGILSPELRADLMGKNGNIAQDTATARMLVGTTYALLIGGLAAEGYVSGSGPSDPRQAAIWRLAGNQAHSVRIGDTWYDVHRLGPLGMLMGIAADMYDVAHAASSGDMLQAGSMLQHAITQNILDESFMRGPSDLIKAVDDPGRYGEAYIRSTLSSFVPYSVGLSQMARASDPYSRQARTLMDSIKQKIPGLSESLLPRRDIWGEPLPNRDVLGAPGVTAIYEQKMSRDPVNLALLDLGIHPAAVERKIRNVELTDDQYDDFQRIAGRMTKMRLDALVNSPDFQYFPNHLRRNVIEEMIKGSRESARGVMMMKYPTIPKQGTQAKHDRLLKD